MLKFIATCLTQKQSRVCESYNIEVVQNYARSYGEIKRGAITDFSVHCFNSDALATLKDLGVVRATLHPELNLAQIRDIKKCIQTECIFYGRLTLMKMENPPAAKELTDRTGTKFIVQGEVVYNSVPVFMADKLDEVQKAGFSHGRLMFTTESPEDVRAVIKAYMERKALKIPFTRGKFYAKV
jgi:putative protease